MSKVRDMAEPMAMDLDRRDPNNLNEHLQVSKLCARALSRHVYTLLTENGLLSHSVPLTFPLPLAKRMVEGVN